MSSLDSMGRNASSLATRRLHPAVPVGSLIVALLAAVVLLPGCGRTAPNSSKGTFVGAKIGRPYSPGVVYIGNDHNLWSVSTKDGPRKVIEQGVVGATEAEAAAPAKRLLPKFAGDTTRTVVTAFAVSPDRGSVALMVERRTVKKPEMDGADPMLLVGDFGESVIWSERIDPKMVSRQAEMCWSPDSKRLAFVQINRRFGPLAWSSSDDIYHLTILDVAKRTTRRLLSRPGLGAGDGVNANVVWAGPERLLAKAGEAFEGHSGGHFYDVCWMYVYLDGTVRQAAPQTSENHAVANFGENGFRLLRRYRGSHYLPEFPRAAWSPDGSWLAFIKPAEARRPVSMPTQDGWVKVRAARELWRVHKTGLRDSRSLQKLESADFNVLVRGFAWSTDGSSIFYWKHAWTPAGASRAATGQGPQYLMSIGDANRRRPQPKMVWLRRLAFPQQGDYLAAF